MLSRRLRRSRHVSHCTQLNALHQQGSGNGGMEYPLQTYKGRHHAQTCNLFNVNRQRHDCNFNLCARGSSAPAQSGFLSASEQHGLASRRQNGSHGACTSGWRDWVSRQSSGIPRLARRVAGSLVFATTSAKRSTTRCTIMMVVCAQSVVRIRGDQPRQKRQPRDDRGTNNTRGQGAASGANTST